LLAFVPAPFIACTMYEQLFATQEMRPVAIFYKMCENRCGNTSGHFKASRKSVFCLL